MNKWVYLGVLSLLAACDVPQAPVVTGADGQARIQINTSGLTCYNTRCLDINPAARSILGLGPRMQPDTTWEQTFCCIDGNGENYKNSASLPLVRARSGEKFANQVAIYRVPDQVDTLLSINGQGLYDGKRDLIGGVITFRDITDQAKRNSELQKLAQYDELTNLPNRSLFIEQLARAELEQFVSRDAVVLWYSRLPHSTMNTHRLPTPSWSVDP